MTSDRHRILLTLGACLFAFALVGASSCRDEQTGKVIFKHEIHANLGIACKDCHETGGVVPTIETCKTCHQEAMDSVTLKDIAGILGARTPAAKPYGLAFAHAKHEGLECSSCHSVVNARMTTPPMKTCLDACHSEKASYPLSCRSCHTQLDARGRPLDHATGWTTRHGVTASASAENCKSCHTEESCFNCHRVTRPENHTNSWRLRGHGVVAQADRERCLACHQENYCSTCHLGTQPINHTSAWKGMNFWTHCNNCHLPISNERCTTCHLGAPHSSAPPWGPQPTHVSGANCRGCHIGPGAGLNHPDNGDNCETCHAK